MYAAFKKQVRQGQITLRGGRRISLFGRNEGWIPWLLKETIPPSQDEPFPWHLNIQKALVLQSVQKEFPNAGAIVVDIKPTVKDEFFVCELEDVYGYSNNDWTPLLWCMRVLQIGNRTPKVDHLEDFDAPDNGDIVCEFLYAQGSINRGEITGTWNPPKPSATNGALLWPDVVTYFSQCLRERAGGISGTEL